MPIPDGVSVAVQGSISEIILNVHPVNAMSSAAYNDLIAAIDQCVENEETKVVLVRSANEKVFCAGADVRELATIAGNQLADERRQLVARRAYEALLDIPVPTIAVVNGPALGAGAVIAACCDIRIASDTATIGLPELTVARCGGTRHLRALLPAGVVRSMYFTGDALSAAEALQYGLYNKMVPAGEELTVAKAMAAKISERSRLALRLAKEVIDLTETMSVRTGYHLEQRYSVTLGATHDGKEGSRAFAEHRRPEWTDK